MTRIICVGDIHLSDRPPINAIESYTEDILDMLSYIADLEVSLKADAVVLLGDIFHHKQPVRTSHALILRALETFSKFKNLLVVVGNHDISNDRLASIQEKQPLGVLLAAGVMKELNGWDISTGTGLPVYGIPWQQNWTTDPRTVEDAFGGWRERLQDWEGKIDKADADQFLAVTHAPVFPHADTPPYEFVTDTAIADAMRCGGSFTYGHIHDRFGIWEEGGVQFANLGAISRGSLTESNLTRPIQVSLWEDGKFTAIDIPHKPASEVFKIEEAAASKETRLSLDDFLADVGTSTLEMSSTESVIEFIERADLPPRIKKILVEILESV